MRKFYLPTDLAVYFFSVRRNWLLPLTFSAWLVFIYFFWKTGDPFPILSPKHGLYIFLGFYCVLVFISSSHGFLQGFLQ